MKANVVYMEHGECAPDARHVVANVLKYKPYWGWGALKDFCATLDFEVRDSAADGTDVWPELEALELERGLKWKLN